VSKFDNIAETIGNSPMVRTIGWPRTWTSRWRWRRSTRWARWRTGSPWE